MMFPAAATVLASIATVLGQRVVINPVNGLVAHPNTPYTFELDRPDFQSSSVDVAVVVGHQACATPQSCIPSFFGDVVFNGLYRPVNDPSGNPQKPQNQNITVMIPNSPSGFARLTVTHFALVGASLTSPLVDTSNITLTIV